MENNEKKYLKISYSKCVIFLLLLFILIIGYFVLFFVKPSMFENILINNKTSNEISHSENSNTDFKEPKVEEKKLDLGKYKFNRTGQEHTFDEGWIYSVILKENNEVVVNLSYGSSKTGTYEIKDDVLTCKVTSSTSYVPHILSKDNFRINESRPESDTYEFIILDNNKFSLSKTEVTSGFFRELEHSLIYTLENPNDIKYEEITDSFNDLMYVTSVEKNDNKYTLKGKAYTSLEYTKSDLDKALKDGYLYMYGDKYYLVGDYFRTNSYNEDYKYIFNNGRANIGIKERKDGKYDVFHADGQIYSIFVPVEKYVQITVDGSTPLIEDYYEFKSTVKEEFDNFKDLELTENAIPNACYHISFKDGKVDKVSYVVASM